MSEPETKEQREAKRIKVFEEGVCHVCGEPLDQIVKISEIYEKCSAKDPIIHREQYRPSRVMRYECFKCEAKLPIHEDMQMETVLQKKKPLQDK
jgi:hypothetical protein